jgi:hypothetical protein
VKRGSRAAARSRPRGSDGCEGICISEIPEDGADEATVFDEKGNPVRVAETVGREVQPLREVAVRIDAKELEALKRVARSSDGRVLQSALTADYLTTMKNLIGASADNVQRLQGRAALLDELLNVLNPEIE